ncbi:hypothetical protein JCM11491_003517 [Sporobolomyces phaffii]
MQQPVLQPSLHRFLPSIRAPRMPDATPEDNAHSQGLAAMFPHTDFYALSVYERIWGHLDFPPEALARNIYATILEGVCVEVIRTIHGFQIVDSKYGPSVHNWILAFDRATELTLDGSRINNPANLNLSAGSRYYFRRAVISLTLTQGVHGDIEAHPHHRVVCGALLSKAGLCDQAIDWSQLP